jgi:hypothetical protein
MLRVQLAQQAVQIISVVLQEACSFHPDNCKILISAPPNRKIHIMSSSVDMSRHNRVLRLTGQDGEAEALLH